MVGRRARWRRSLPGLAAGLLAAAGPAEACRLALVLAIDVSSSVDPEEDALQRNGLAYALTAPAVVQAFLADPDPVALYVFEWSARFAQVPLTPGWVLIEEEADLREVAARIAGSPRSYSNFPTAVGYALGHAATLIRAAPDCRAATVDIAGDGVNNEGFPPAMAYRHFPFEGVTVNALVVTGTGDRLELLSWFENEVLRGPTAFMEVAEGYGDYARAMERKLLRELAIPALSGLGDLPPAAPDRPAPGRQ